MHSHKTKRNCFIVEVQPSTISRELKRNTAQRGRTAGIYKAENAQHKTEMRHRSKRKHILLAEQLKTGICRKPEFDKWSTELISQDFKQKGETA